MPKDARSQRRHNPLHEEILENTSGNLRRASRSKRKERSSKPEEYVDASMSRKILQIAREQQDELVDEAAVGAAMRGDFMGAGAGQMRFEEEEEGESEGEYEDGGFGEDEIVEEVVGFWECGLRRGERSGLMFCRRLTRPIWSCLIGFSRTMGRRRRSGCRSRTRFWRRLRSMKRVRPGR